MRDDLDRELIERLPVQFRRALLCVLRQGEQAHQQGCEVTREIPLRLILRGDGKIERGEITRSYGW